MYNVNYEIASCIFLLILFMYLKLQYTVKSEINKVFSRLVILTFVTGLLDVVTALMINSGERISNSVNIWVNTLYLAFDAIMGYQFCRYFSFAAHKKPNATFLAKDGWFLVVLHCFLLLANVFSGFIFSFDNAHHYVRGPLYILVYAIPQFLILSGLFIIFRNRKVFTNSQIFSIVLFAIIGFSGSFLQLLVFEHYTLALFTTSIAIFMITFAMETPDYLRLIKTMDELKSTANRLNRANKAKSEFLANMSHELRTPINSILGYNELIVNETVENHIAEYALNVQAGARALLAQVNNVFDYTDMDKGQFKLYLNKYYANSLLQDIVLYSRFSAERKNIAFKIDVDEKIPYRLNGDVVRIMQVMTNLLSNAFKFTQAGLVSLWVKWVPLGTMKGKIAVKITDTGCGIKPRLLSVLGHDAQIMGLGLPLVTKLLTMMGSELKIESEVGKGTTVSFELEQDVEESRPIGKVDFTSRNAVLGHIDDGAFIAPQVRMLVVDDNDMNLKLFCGLLKDTKITFDIAHDGNEALQKMSENSYDMIFLDHMMPVKDGVQTLYEMKTRNICLGVPVVVLTANSVVGARDKYLEEGFDGYVSKPVNVGELRTCIREHLPREKFIDVSNDKSVKNAEDFIELLPDQIDGSLGISYCEGDKNRYLEALLDFENAKRVELLDDFYRNRDLEQYRNLLRNVKISALGIGAVKLSTMAKSLEHAAASGDWTFIDANHGDMLMSFRLLMSELAKVIQKTDRQKIAKSQNTPLILVVDDEAVNLRIAEKVLGETFEVKTAESSEEALELMESKIPDLVLLDVNMPVTNGFEMFKKMQESERTRSIPVVFLTADENVQTEVDCFNAGAMDFVKKPLVKDVVIRRVNRILQLSALQRNLQKEVDSRTHELLKEQQNSEQLSSQIMKSLAATIDAKDKYTKNHSARVAKYAQMLCKALGMSEQEQKDVYSMGLLHDVGKIAVPNEIINKTSRLTDEEFAIIKTHSAIGGDILKSISSFPGLAEAARHHHERYDGHGYPDGLKGSEIPELVRIICIADAYDAMASTRSYRGILPQAEIREEIEKCSGAQFDPKMAAKMIELIDEDKNFLMKE